MKKFFFIIWGDPKFYQTLIFLSQKIASQNSKIYILSRNLDHKKNIIKKINFGNNVTILKCPKIISRFSNFFEYFIFFLFVGFQFFLKKPSSVIFFNKKALYTILLLNVFKFKSNFIYHNFDFDLIKNVHGIKEKIQVKLEFFCSRFCKNIVFPSNERAKIFKKISQNKKSQFFYFLNCFPKKFQTRNNIKFMKFLKDNNLLNKKIICHLGSIGPNHYLDEIVESFNNLNDKIILIIAGNSINNYALYLKKKIKKNNLDKKIYILEDVSNDHWFEILKRSKMGLCFYKQISTSHKFMAGTSQKFNNYVCFNKPMIVNNNKDFKKFKKIHDIFDVVKKNSSKEISLSIKKLLQNKQRFIQIKKNMKKAFSEDLNFEKQFENSYKKFL